MSGVSTHVLDLAKGQPAVGLLVLLEVKNFTGAWKLLTKGQTDADGRVADLVSTILRLQARTYRLTFDVATYSRLHNLTSLYPEINVVFSIRDTGQHYHIRFC